MLKRLKLEVGKFSNLRVRVLTGTEDRRLIEDVNGERDAAAKAVEPGFVDGVGAARKETSSALSEALSKNGDGAKILTEVPAF